ncbi:MAG: TIGR04222 domain-containing membrane protein [Bryobacterales bacterium]
MDWIANMPGPQFLGLYASLIAVALAGAYFAMRASPQGDGLQPVVPSSPDPYEMAYLRGGEMEVSKLALIELARGGYIQERVGTALRGGKVLLGQSEGASPSRLSAPLRQIFDLVGGDGKSPGELMRESGFRGAVGQIVARFEPRVQREGLLVPTGRKMAVFLYTAMPILSLGGYKLAVALSKGRYNVGFLIIFTLVALIALRAITSQRLTARGKKYFWQTQEAYRGETGEAVLDASPATAPPCCCMSGCSAPDPVWDRERGLCDDAGSRPQPALRVVRLRIVLRIELQRRRLWRRLRRLWRRLAGWPRCPRSGPG